MSYASQGSALLAQRAPAAAPAAPPVASAYGGGVKALIAIGLGGAIARIMVKAWRSYPRTPAPRLFDAHGRPISSRRRRPC